MKGNNGIQCHVHIEFLNMLHRMQDDWHKLHSNRKRDLSIKRLSLTLTRLFKLKPDLYIMVINSEINLNEE